MRKVPQNIRNYFINYTKRLTPTSVPSLARAKAGTNSQKYATPYAERNNSYRSAKQTEVIPLQDCRNREEGRATFKDTIMNYYFVCYVYKCNYIIVRTMKSRKDADMVATFKDIYGKLKVKGHQPKLHVLDNECSKAIKTYVASTQTNCKSTNKVLGFSDRSRTARAAYTPKK